MTKIVDYASLTTADKNPIKRWLQNLRLNQATRCMRYNSEQPVLKILDYGAGNGELAKRLSLRFPKALITCYEPAAGYRKQVMQNTAGNRRIISTGNLETLMAQTFDYIFCMEVLEHLVDADIDLALNNMYRLLKRDGKLIVGVPNEIYLPAFIKGIFRMTRRARDVDGNLVNILQSGIGLPPKDRPVAELENGLTYIFRHMGFDYRKLARKLKQVFLIEQRYGSPLPFLFLSINFEVYFVASINIAEIKKIKYE